MKRHIFGGICQVLFRKKWGDFNYEQRKSLEKSRLRIPRRYYGEKGEAFDKCMQMESPKELEQWLLKVCEKLQETVQQERQASTRSFVSRAVEYVQEHYSDRNITIESVCRELGVSAAYFSTIFKKETGKTFISFLTDYRMEKAVELLMTTSDKTYIIAEKVGYADPNYFSYAFKKQYSMSPSKYRTANSQG